MMVPYYNPEHINFDISHDCLLDDDKRTQEKLRIKD